MPLLPIGTAFKDKTLGIWVRVVAHTPDQFGRLREQVEPIPEPPATPKATRQPKPRATATPSAAKVSIKWPKTTSPKPKVQKPPRAPVAKRVKAPAKAKVVRAPKPKARVKLTWRNWLAFGELATVGAVGLASGILPAAGLFLGVSAVQGMMGRKKRTKRHR